MSWNWGYGPGNPVGGVELPVVTCNDLKDDWPTNPFKLYTDSDSKKCGGYPRNKLPDACNDACQAQYDDCVDVYAQGCKSKKRRDNSYFEVKAASEDEKAKRWYGWTDNYSTAVTKCQAQLADCKAENKQAAAGSKCYAWGAGW